jgi:GNAT superfamily N-acetyltransferase
VLKLFSYQEDKKLESLKVICRKTGSARLKQTFEYLRFLFYRSEPNKIISEFIPETAYYVATICKNHIRLVDIGVTQENQKKGIGKYLLNRVIMIASKLGKSKVTLRTSQYETSYIFYQKFGFQIVGAKGEDLEMELIL